jgi:hypothetical protein
VELEKGSHILFQQVSCPYGTAVTTLGANPGGIDLHAPGEQKQRQGPLYPFLSHVTGVNATLLARNDASLLLSLGHKDILA